MLNSSELIEIIMKSGRIKKRIQAEMILKGLLGAISKELTKEDGEVLLKRIGSLRVKEFEERSYSNPQTREIETYKPKAIKFAASRVLKKRLKDKNT